MFGEGGFVFGGEKSDEARVFGEFCEFFVLGAVADDEEGALGHKASFDGEIDSLPIHLARGGDEGRIRTIFSDSSEVMRLDRGVDDNGVAAVIFFDQFPGVFGDGDVIVGVLGGF